MSNGSYQQESSFQERNISKVDFVETGVTLIVEITIVIVKMNIFMMRMKMMMTAVIVIVILMLKMLPIVIIVIMMMIDSSGDNVLYIHFSVLYTGISFLKRIWDF